MGRGMIKKEIQALETASLEFFRNGKTETIPHIYVSLFCHHKERTIPHIYVSLFCHHKERTLRLRNVLSLCLSLHCPIRKLNMQN